MLHVHLNEKIKTISIRSSQIKSGLGVPLFLHLSNGCSSKKTYFTLYFMTYLTKRLENLKTYKKLVFIISGHAGIINPLHVDMSLVYGEPTNQMSCLSW